MASSTHTHDADSHHIEAGVDIKKVIAVGVVSLTLFAISAVVAYFILRGSRGEFISQHGLAPAGKLEGQAEINIVDSIHFDSDTRLERWKGEMRKRLDGYGWVDKQQRLIHVPIEKAMQQVIEDAAKQPVKQAVPTTGEGAANGSAADATKTQAAPNPKPATKPTTRPAPNPNANPAAIPEGAPQ